MLSEHVESWTDQWKREGLEQGFKQGTEQRRQEMRHLLGRLARRRFGPAIAAQAEPLQAAIASPQQLEELGELLLACPDGAEWLQALRQAQPDSSANE